MVTTPFAFVCATCDAPLELIDVKEGQTRACGENVIREIIWRIKPCENCLVEAENEATMEAKERAET